MEKRVLLIEDDEFYQKVWQYQLPAEKLMIAPSFAHFLQLSETMDWSLIDLIISDFYLENGRTACDVVDVLKAKAVGKPIYLCSEIDHDGLLDRTAFAGVLPKAPGKALQRLQSFMSKE